MSCFLQAWKKLYHYTDEEGFEGIKRSGVLRKSGNVLYGPGVYLTSLDPVSHSKQEIAGAAWGPGCEYREIDRQIERERERERMRGRVESKRDRERERRDRENKQIEELKGRREERERVGRERDRRGRETGG